MELRYVVKPDPKVVREIEAVKPWRRLPWAVLMKVDEWIEYSRYAYSKAAPPRLTKRRWQERAIIFGWAKVWDFGARRRSHGPSEG
jgi:hypothetical protein